MALLNHPVLRTALGSWYVDVTVASGTRLTWGPYSQQDAQAQIKRLRQHPELLLDRVREQRERRAPRPKPEQQEGLF